jgi:hypothetical protein
MGVGVFARLQPTPGIRQWDPRAENWVPISASIWDQNPRLGPALRAIEVVCLNRRLAAPRRGRAAVGVICALI